MLQCCYCSKKFKYESERKRHEQSHVPQFECKECHKKFSFLSALKRHEKQHERTGSVKCSDCGKHFRDDTLLNRHIKYAHKGTYVCSKCKTTFNSDLALSLHQKSHKPSSERRFQCSYDGCVKTFNHRHHLRHHELNHVNAKQHYCNICGKGFIQYHHYKSHIRSHTPNVWLPCTVSGCNKQFSMEYARKRHLLNHKEIENSGISNLNCDDSKDKEEPDVILCTTCGVMVQVPLYDTHITQCKTNSDTPQDLTTKIITLNNNYINETHPEGGLDVFMNDNIYQMKSDTYNSIETSRNNNNEVKCEGCECSKDCLNTPEIEYRSNGVVKLKDVSLEADICISDVNINKLVPYNSCKSVLGKCIVSGSGTISEECLCAKMALEQPMMEQEIDEITPRPVSME